MLTIYKASAGSGKTYTLAYEYIKLLLGQKLGSGKYVLNHRDYLAGKPLDTAPHRRILAITFTNKATAEMKDRILKRLNELTELPEPGVEDAEYAGRLMAEFGCTREELKRGAQSALRSLLNDYGQFNVSTIDAFFQTVLRSFAREIDRQGDFRLELDEDTVLGEAMSLMFDEINANPKAPGVEELVGWLGETAKERVGEGKDFNPFNRRSGMYGSIVGSLKKVYDSTFMERQGEMLDYLADNSSYRAFIARLRELIAGIREEEKALADGFPLSPDGLKANVATYFALIFENGGIYGKAEDKTFGQNGVTKATPATDCMEHNYEKFYTKKAYPGIEADDVIFAWFDRLLALCRRRRVYEGLLRETGTLWALIHISAYVERYRLENNLILLADTNTLLGSIIGEDGGDTPFIYERAGMQLENFLIDEFQDTSKLQWRNLRPLVDNSLAFGADDLIIGDVKQSIYRFRGAQPELLGTRVGEDFQGKTQSRGTDARDNTNYRSAHGIVRFNNTLFAELANSSEPPVPGYEDVAQSLAPGLAHAGSYINFRLFPKGTEKETAIKFLGDTRADELEKAGELTLENVSFELMARRILEQHEAGYEFKDIAILCRVNTTSTRVAQFLAKNFPEIPIVSEEALLLRNSQAVKLIVSMLEIIDKSFAGGSVAAEGTEIVPGGGEPQNPGAPRVIGQSTRVIESPEVEKRLQRAAKRRMRAMLIDSFNYYLAHGDSVDDALVKSLANARNAALDATPGKHAATTGTDLDADLDAIRRLAPSTLPALVEAIIAGKVSETDRNAEMPYITAFVDLVSDFASRFTPSVHAFLKFWHDKKDKFSIAASEKAEAVTIITVHKAKGLEWKCLHIPEMDWGLAGSLDPQWYDMGVIEEIPAAIRPPMMYLKGSTSWITDEGSPFKDVAEARMMEQRGDNLNVAYVAFTRAGRELDVNMFEKAGGNLTVDLCRVFGVSKDYGDDTRLMSLGNYWDAARLVFSYGAPTDPAREKAEKERIDAEKGRKASRPEPKPGVMDAAPFRCSFTTLNAQVTRLEDLTHTDPEGDDPDAGATEYDRFIVDEPRDELMELRARKGIIMHSILSRMYTAADLGHALDYYRHTLGAAELEEYRAEVESFFEDAPVAVKEWFSPDNERVLNEQSIYNAVDNSIRRADRIILREDGGADVVDYKFTSAERPEHHEQVKAYAGMLGEMGYSPVRAWLWYPQLGKVVAL